jgi:prepilin-type processing-associated H-X9-DG protein
MSSDSPAIFGDNQSAWAGFDWDNHQVAWNPNSRWPPETYQPREDVSGYELAGCFAFGSAHAGALNMAYCDGSVQSISYDIDFEVHRQQANRMDGN